MKKHTTTKTMRRSLPVFAQIVQLIPAGRIEKLVEACRIKARVFSYAHQIYALMLGQLAGAFSLNEICDDMAVHCKKLFRVRRLLPARRNTFSNANRTRDPDVVQKLFWEMYERLRLWRGKCGRRCWSTCSCGIWRTPRRGRGATRASREW